MCLRVQTADHLTVKGVVGIWVIRRELWIRFSLACAMWQPFNNPVSIDRVAFFFGSRAVLDRAEPVRRLWPGRLCLASSQGLME